MLSTFFNNKNVKRNITLAVNSRAFNMSIMCLVLLNAISISFEADIHFRNAYSDVFTITNEVFYGLFLLEFCLKSYVLRRAYWNSTYNVLDFLVLLGFIGQNIITLAFGPVHYGIVAKIVGFIRIIKTLRTLRLITYIKELEVLMKALLESLAKFVIYIIIFLFLIIFLFALLGYYLFGYMVNKEGYWKNLWESLLSILTYVTAEGWRDVQAELDINYQGLGRTFSVIALIVGNFILMNVFVGIIVMNISDALSSFKDEKLVILEKLKEKKKEILLSKYQKDIARIQENMDVKDSNFHENLVEYYKTLPHNDPIIMVDVTTSMMWMETLMKTLGHQENTLWRITQLLNEMTNAMIDESERRLQISESFKSLIPKRHHKIMK